MRRHTATSSLFFFVYTSFSYCFKGTFLSAHRRGGCFTFPFFPFHSHATHDTLSLSSQVTSGEPLQSRRFWYVLQHGNPSNPFFGEPKNNEGHRDAPHHLTLESVASYIFAGIYADVRNIVTTLVGSKLLAPFIYADTCVVGCNSDDSSSIVLKAAKIQTVT